MILRTCIRSFFLLAAPLIYAEQVLAGCPAGYICTPPSEVSPWKYYEAESYGAVHGWFSSPSDVVNAQLAYLSSYAFGSVPGIYKAGPLALPRYFCQMGQCSSDNLWADAAYFSYDVTYTENGTQYGPYQHTVGGIRTFSCNSGSLNWLIELGAYTPYCLSKGDSLLITKPSSNQIDPITQESNYISRTSIFNTNAVSTPIVGWTVTLSYQTSGGRGAYTENMAFFSGAAVPVEKEISSKGGKAIVKASAYVNGSLQEKTLVFYLTGKAIPEDTITNRLLDLYRDGATPRLLTGITQLESTYHQFTNRTLLGIGALWPNESYDGGSHIGLMQIDTRKGNQYAWDWVKNTEAGADLFREKLARANRIEASLHRLHPNLRQLTGVELEKMALVLYGPYASSNIDGQYYRVTLERGGPTWVINTLNNPYGIAYANRVIQNIR